LKQLLRFFILYKYFAETTEHVSKKNTVPGKKHLLFSEDGREKNYRHIPAFQAGEVMIPELILYKKR
jgi:hypothetical protein